MASTKKKRKPRARPVALYAEVMACRPNALGLCTGITMQHPGIRTSFNGFARTSKIAYPEGLSRCPHEVAAAAGSPFLPLPNMIFRRPPIYSPPSEDDPDDEGLDDYDDYDEDPDEE